MNLKPIFALRYFTSQAINKKKSVSVPIDYLKQFYLKIHPDTLSSNNDKHKLINTNALAKLNNLIDYYKQLQLNQPSSRLQQLILNNSSLSQDSLEFYYNSKLITQKYKIPKSNRVQICMTIEGIVLQLLQKTNCKIDEETIKQWKIEWQKQSNNVNNFNDKQSRKDDIADANYEHVHTNSSKRQVDYLRNNYKDFAAIKKETAFQQEFSAKINQIIDFMIESNKIAFDEEYRPKEQTAIIHSLKVSLSNLLVSRPLESWLGISIHINSVQNFEMSAVLWNIGFPYTDPQLLEFFTQWFAEFSISSPINAEPLINANKSS
jgi:hypothetical protein